MNFVGSVFLFQYLNEESSISFLIPVLLIKETLNVILVLKIFIFLKPIGKLHRHVEK